MSLIPIICTHEVSSTVLTSVLSTAYDASRKIDSPPSLILVTTTDTAEIQKYTHDFVTKIPIESFQYPFLDWDIGQIAQFLRENAPETLLDHTTFLVADDKTALDEDTLLLVHDIDDSQTSIRLSATHVNSRAVSVSVATTDVRELRSLADDDGVYRGRSQCPPPQKGGKAPRKKLQA